MHDEGVALPNHFLRPCDGSWCGEESPLLVFYITLPEIDRPLSWIEALPMSEFKVPQSIVAIFFFEEKGEIERCVFFFVVGMCLKGEEVCWIVQSEKVFVV